MCILRNPTHLLLPRVDTLPILVPAVVELALIFVGPLLEDVVRPGCIAPGAQYMKNGLSDEKACCFAEPLDRVLGDVFGEMIAFLRWSSCGFTMVVLRTMFGSYCDASPARKP